MKIALSLITGFTQTTGLYVSCAQESHYSWAIIPNTIAMDARKIYLMEYLYMRIKI